MIYWNDFVHEGKVYPLNHLHPEIWEYVQEAKGDKPERRYRIRILYSLHTFTKEGHYPPYSDNRETREFCFDRHKVSAVLPEVIKTLGRGYVLHTGRDNFLKLEDGYEVYFTLLKSKEKVADLQLYIESAYVRTKGHTPNGGKIRFPVLCYNVLNNKKVKPHRR